MYPTSQPFKHAICVGGGGPKSELVGGEWTDRWA